MIRGSKDRHSTEVVKLAARARVASSTVARAEGEVLSVVRAKGESAYFTSFVER